MCGFWKAHSTQHAISKLLASLQKSLDEGGFVGSILMDLSKKKGCLPFKDPYWGHYFLKFSFMVCSFSR